MQLVFYKFRRQLEYQPQRSGSQLVLVDQFYPSSQICSSLGRGETLTVWEEAGRKPQCPDKSGVVLVLWSRFGDDSIPYSARQRNSRIHPAV